MLASQIFERRLLQLWLLLGDGFGLLVCFIIAQNIRFQSFTLLVHLESLFRDGRFLTVYFMFAISHYIFDLYEPRHWRSSLFAPLKIIFASSTAALLLFAWFYFVATTTGGVYGRGVLLGAISGFTLFSLIFRYFVDRSQRKRTQKRRWLLIGNEKSYQTLSQDLAKLRLGDSLVWQDREKLNHDLTSLQNDLKKNWAGLIVDTQIDNRIGENLAQQLMQLRLSGQTVLSIQNFYEFFCGKVPLHSLDVSWFALTEGFSILHSQISARLKRLSDIFISVFMLITLSPIMALVALLVKIESRGPALYSQIRVGQNGRTFLMWKFRSMQLNAEEQTGPRWADKKDSRITRLGQLMRKVRLDELPQLWNILKGEMSFIGPRPERPEFTAELRKKISFYDLRHLVKPGLTGWAQVMYPYGASEADAYEKLQFDLFYIKNYSFGRDIEIILKTITVVLFGAGR